MTSTIASAQAGLARPYASVVVGTDFTPCSAVAIGEAIRVAAWSDAPVHAVHVIDTTVVIEVETSMSEFQQSLRDNLVADAQRAWTEFTSAIPGAADIALDVRINSRLVGIFDHARAHHADLLVMGAFGERQPEVGVGTVATACVRKSMTDVLLVRDTRSGPYRRIVAAVDFSETSGRALARAAFFAAQDRAELHVLHAFTAPWRRVRYQAPIALEAPHLQRQYRDAIERRLAEFARPIAESNPDLAIRLICHDDGGHRSAIVEYASSVSADLIALGTRGRTNLRDILLGSTAEKALQESRCSVLAVKPEGFRHPLAEEPPTPRHPMRPLF